MDLLVSERNANPLIVLYDFSGAGMVEETWWRAQVCKRFEDRRRCGLECLILFLVTWAGRRRDQYGPVSRYSTQIVRLTMLR